jgi:type IV pilus assembly protein PilE
MKNSIFLKRVPAWSLQEMLVVMGIVGLLFLVAMPLVEPLFNKARSMEAKTQLSHLFTLQKSYYYEHSKYSNDLSNIGFEQAKLKTEDGGQANYRIEILDAGTTGFKARATAIIDFDNDGVFSVWEIDENQNLQEVTPD